MTDEKTEAPEPKPAKEIDGKRVKTFEVILPVSGDTVEVIEAGLLTARLMERTVGYKAKAGGKGTVAEKFGVFIDNATKLFDKFVPKHCPDLKRDKYTDDDLWAIVFQLYVRGSMQLGQVVGAAESFPVGGGGKGPGDDGVDTETPAE